MQKLLLVIASRNEHKVSEIRALMAEQENVRCLSLIDLPTAPTVVEEGQTFADNAAGKATQLANWFAADPARLPAADSETKILVLADDSGLEVDALGGQPGVHSARFASLDKGSPENAGDGENNAKLLRLLGDSPSEKRTARFRCFLALAPVPAQAPLSSEAVKLFVGVCEGAIGFGPRGELGFGYDPLFILEGQKRTFGELAQEEKNQISHRSRALEKLKTQLKALAG